MRAGAEGQASPARLVGFGLAMAAASGALWSLAFSLHPAWWAAWAAPVPVLLAVSDARLPRWHHRFWPGLIAMLAGLAGGIGFLPYFLAVTGVVPGLIITLLRAVGTCFAVTLAGAWMRRSAGLGALLAYPAAVAAIEVLVSWLSADGTAGSLAYSQMDQVPVLQVASLGGVAMVAFLPSLGASLFALATRRGRRARGAAVAGFALLAAMLGFGGLRVALAPPPQIVGVALLAQDAPLAHTADAALAVYQPALAQNAAGRAQIVVLPEKITTLTAAEAGTFSDRLSGLARARNQLMVAGMAVQTEAGRFNRAWAALPDGSLAQYDKQHLVRGWEDGVLPGERDLTLGMAAGRLGIAICKDLDFASLGRRYGRQDVRLMLVPAWDFAGDFGADGALHARMAVLRGVEGGFAVARSARQGRLTVSDRYGTIWTDQPSGVQGPALAIAPAPVAPDGPTLYARIGDSFGGMALLLTAYLWWRRPRDADARGIAARNDAQA